jgi:hypothetical protein
LPLAANVRLFRCAIHEGIPQMLRLLVILSKDSTIAFYGAILSAAAITALFFGQRIAKDYAGAAVLVPYFLLTLVAIYLLAQPVT